VRLRLTWSEVERLRETGLVEESVNFGAGEVLAYRLQSGMEQVLVGAAFRQGIVTVSVSKEAAQAISATLQTQAQPKARPPGRLYSWSALRLSRGPFRLRARVIVPISAPPWAKP